jgi:hypothetical protein
MRSSITAREETFIVMDLPAVPYEGCHRGRRGVRGSGILPDYYFPNLPVIDNQGGVGDGYGRNDPARQYFNSSAGRE